MKLLHILMIAANACPADDPWYEITKESQVRSLFLGGETM